MKSCPMCGTDAEESAPVCEKCRYTFKVGDGTLPASSQSAAPSSTIAGSIASDRPTGQIPMVIGWICFALSIILIFVSFGQGPESWEVSSAKSLAGNPYAPPDTFSRVTEAYARQWLFQVAAGGFFSLFLVLWSVGYVVKAVSFLPAADRRAE